MKIKAHAKINLGLDVLRRRPDGYHEVRMVMQTIGVCDELTIELTDTPGIFISTDRKDLPVNEDNLIHKAAKLMMEEYSLAGGINVQLTKNIPVAAGLAGGSTDAAAVLVALNELSGLGLDGEALMKLGVRIGADVPYCIMGGCALAEGIGEILTPLERCPQCRILLAKPPEEVSTAYVYGHLDLDNAVHPDIDAVIDGIRSGSIMKIAKSTGNILESVTEAEYPRISQIKKTMTDNGALISLMSGSGPTVFGLFESDEDADRAYDALSKSGDVSELFITQFYDPKR